jgi:hypothetical protein
MNIWDLMKGMWVLSNAREILIKAWVSAQDLQWVNFSDPTSLWNLAAKIMPEVLKKNPQIADQIKNSWRLEWKQKQEVIEMIDRI